MRKYKLITMALAAALVLGVSCSHSGKKADDAIVTGIKAKMFSEPALNAANVEVASQSGVVTLAGQVPDEAAHLAAYKIATQTAGVSKVNDQLSVGNPQQAMASAPSPSEQPAAAPPPSKVKAKPLSKSAQQIENSESSAPPDADTPVPAPSPEVAAPPSPAPAPQPVKVTIPANTIVSVRTIDGVDSSKDRTGEVFKASVDAPSSSMKGQLFPSGQLPT